MGKELRARRALIDKFGGHNMVAQGDQRRPKVISKWGPARTDTWRNNNWSSAKSKAEPREGPAQASENARTCGPRA
jgi:hypothetical protein